MSYTKVLYHIVLRSKNGVSTIEQKHSEQLYRYIWGIIKNKRCTLYQINGMEDHIHLVSVLYSVISLADYVKDIKVASSLWMKQSARTS